MGRETSMNVRVRRFALISCLLVSLFGASHAARSWRVSYVPPAFITMTPSLESLRITPIPTRDEFAPLSDYLAEVFDPNIAYLVAFLPSEVQLEVQDTPNGDVIDELGNSRQVRLTGESEIIDGETWVSIAYDDLPEDDGNVWHLGDVLVRDIEGQYTGWILRLHLAGNLPRALFCADPRVEPLIDDLRAAVAGEDVQALARIVSPRGLYMSYGGGGVLHLTPDEVHGFFEDEVARNWGNNGYGPDDLLGSLADLVIPTLREDLSSEALSIACTDNQDNLSDNNVLYALPIAGYNIHNFYSLMRPGMPGFELDWSAWGLAFEYWDNQPRLLGIGHYKWTP